MRSILFALLTIGGVGGLGNRPLVPERTGFVTLLGRDTVAVESYTRTATQIEGDMMVRVPGTVLFHYQITLARDGSVASSTLESKPLGMPDMPPRRVTLQFAADSVRMTIDSAAVRRREAYGAQQQSAVLFTSGFDSSFGLYASLGMYEFMLPRIPVHATDTTVVAAVGAATGRTTMRRFMRRSAGNVDVDFFKIAWTHLTLDEAGRITSADASETTEQTQSRRADSVEVERVAKDFAARDRAGRGMGVASPDLRLRATIGAASVFIDHGSPRRRGREILGNVVPFDKVWRTGANAATVLYTDRDLIIGGTIVPAGTYSLWTLPTKNGVALIINKQHGQWGTRYDASQDLARVPMTMESAKQRDDFAMRIDAGKLRIEWDTFAWSVPIAAR